MRSLLRKFGSGDKVIALRTTTSRCSVRTNSQTQSNPGPSDASVPPGIHQQFSRLAQHGSSGSSPSTDYYGAASGMVQTILPPVAAVVGAIPIAGAPLQTAINGLLAILQVIDKYQQNKKDLAMLKSRLLRLSRYLCNAPTAGNPGEQSLRDSLLRMLRETAFELENLPQRGIASTSMVTQVITGCSSEINDYLLEYAAFGQMQMSYEVHATFTAIQSLQSQRTKTLGVVTLVDATGYEHPLPVEYCATFQQVAMMLGVIFQRNSTPAQVQRKYLEAGQYNLSIDHNTEVTQLTTDNWPFVEAGTTIVMSIVVKQRRERTEAYQCYLCKTWNDAPASEKGMTNVVDCGGCGKRFQVSDIDGDEGMQDSEVKQNSEATTDDDSKYVKNWHLLNSPTCNVQRVHEGVFDKSNGATAGSHTEPKGPLVVVKRKGREIVVPVAERTWPEFFETVTTYVPERTWGEYFEEAFPTHPSRRLSKSDVATTMSRSQRAPHGDPDNPRANSQTNIRRVAKKLHFW